MNETGAPLRPGKVADTQPKADTVVTQMQQLLAHMEAQEEKQQVRNEEMRQMAADIHALTVQLAECQRTTSEVLATLSSLEVVEGHVVEGAGADDFTVVSGPEPQE